MVGQITSVIRSGRVGGMVAVVIINRSSQDLKIYSGRLSQLTVRRLAR